VSDVATERPVTDPPRFFPRWRTVLVALPAGAVFALLSFWYRYMDVLARGQAEPFQKKLTEEFTGVFGALALFVPVIWFTRYLKWRKVRWPFQIALHASALGAYAVLHTSLNWAGRSVLFPLAGLGPYDYGHMGLRYLMELGIQIPVYLICVGATLAVDHRHRSQLRDLQLARLEAQLVRTRLANLELRLHPHFLFNALNTVSATMYEDTDRADRLISDLSMLLRRALRSGDAHEWTLDEEVRNLDLYLKVLGARFEDRLDVVMEIEEEAVSSAVPTLLLQPLVENALRHGDPGGGRRAEVRVIGAQVGERLRLEVSDNGPGADAPLDELARRGLGLATTLRRLELLHPGDHRVDADTAPGGGFRVRLDLPFRRVPPDPTSAHVEALDPSPACTAREPHP
jgi:two-component system, LytTR family, sensor kinase